MSHMRRRALVVAATVVMASGMLVASSGIASASDVPTFTPVAGADRYETSSA